MGKFNTRQGLSSLANSDVTGQFGVYGGGASIPLLVDGATNRLLTLSDTNSGSVFYVQDADGTRLFDITTTGIEVGGNYTLPLTDGTASQYLATDGAGAVTWEDLPTSGITTVDVHNNTGSTLSKGSPVYVTGTHASGKPTVALTDADGTGTYPAIGLVSADIANGADGTVVAGGTLANWDTSSYTAGDALYIDTTAGALTATRPTAETSKVQKVAVVTRSHATSGSVIVMGAGRTNDIPNDVKFTDLSDTPSTVPSNGILNSTAAGEIAWSNVADLVTLSGLGDVEDAPLSTSAVNGAYLRYDSTNSQWVADGPHAGFHANRQLGTITKGTPVRRTGSGQGGGIYEMGVGSTNNDYRCVGIAFDAQDASGRLVVMTDGIIGGFDTSSWSADDILYVSNTTGALTNTAPTSGLYVQRVGRVISSNATTGSIQVTVDPAFDETEYLENLNAELIGDLSNVDVTGASSGNVLQYNGTNWVDANLDLEDLGNVNTTGVAQGDYLMWNGSQWVDHTPRVQDTATVINSDSASYVYSTAIASSYAGLKIDYVLKDAVSTNIRIGTIYACTDDTNVEMTDVSTNWLGSESTIPTFSAVKNGSDLEVRITNGNGYIVDMLVSNW